ncbi:MAG: spermidine/putrescine ABC transporter permease [Legionella sp.]|nr:MAG: spermidine/putrescine ABC transporter permease [Legionella sp.]
MRSKPFSIYFIYTWLVVFGLIPIGLIFVVSCLTDNTLHLASLPITAHNYTALMSPLFLKVFLRSTVMAGSATLLCLLLAYPLSYILVKSKHQTLWLFLIIIPFWTSSLIRIYSLIAMLKIHGIFNTVLLKLHIIHEPITFLYSNGAVMFGLVYNLLPFMVLPIFSNMERFDFCLIEAAQDLGANRWVTFFRVFLPNTVSGIIAGSLMVFLPSMTLFYISNILGGARSVLLGNLIQNQFLVIENWPQGAATSMVLTFILIAILCFYRPKKQGVLL